MMSHTHRFVGSLVVALVTPGVWLASPADGATTALPYAGQPPTTASVAAPAGHAGAWHPLRLWSDGVTTNAAYSSNSAPDHLRARTRMALVRTGDDVVSATNTATALAQCTSCRTVSVALEVVLASGEPSALSFDNRAWARNAGCVSCETLAMAYQLAVVAPGVGLSDRGVDRLRSINRRLAEAVGSGRPLDEVAAAVGALVTEAVAVLDEELVTTDTRANGRGRAARAAPAVQVHSAVHRG